MSNACELERSFEKLGLTARFNLKFPSLRHVMQDHDNAASVSLKIADYGGSTLDSDCLARAVSEPQFAGQEDVFDRTRNKLRKQCDRFSPAIRVNELLDFSTDDFAGVVTPSLHRRRHELDRAG